MLLSYPIYCICNAKPHTLYYSYINVQTVLNAVNSFSSVILIYIVFICRGINKYVRENLPEVVHTFDVWHVAKGNKTNSVDFKILTIFCTSYHRAHQKTAESGQ